MGTDRPSTRDRYADALRAGALLVVIYGHWLATLPIARADGHLGDTAHLLHTWAGSAWLTWALQVVPLFVFVSAAVNAPSLTRATAAGTPFAAWFQGRLHGLARPVAVYLTGWLVIAGTLRTGVALDVNGAEGAWRVLGFFSTSLTVHLWFIAMIVATQALLPWSLRFDGKASWRAVFALLGAAAVVDAARFFLLGDSPLAGLPNAIIVWMIPQQLGVLWSRANLTRRHGTGFALLGIVGLFAGVAAGYPVALVGGDIGDNNVLPPTLMIAAVAVMQAGLVILLARPARALLERRSVYAPVQILGAVGMPLYLWHKSFEPLLASVLSVFGKVGIVAGEQPGDPSFWAHRATWILLLTVAVLPFAAWQLKKAAAERAKPKPTVKVEAVALSSVRVRSAGAAVVLGVLIAMVAGVTSLPQMAAATALMWTAVRASQPTSSRADRP